MRGQEGFSGLDFGKAALIPERIGLLAMIALFTGCRDTTGAAAGWLTATIEQRVVAAESSSIYEGTGDFNVGKDPGYGVDIAFGLHSVGTGASLGQNLGLSRPGAGRPGTGRYQLAPLEVKEGRMKGFTAFYHRRSAGRVESYTALSGEIEVTESSSERVAGGFRFTGVLYCSVAEVGPAPDDWCTGPNTITPGAPRIEVTGRFSAVPLKPGVETPSVP